MPVLLDDIQNKVLPLLIDAFKKAIDDTDTSYFERAEKGRSNNEQNHFFDAMRLLRLAREDALLSFEQGLRERFSSFPKYKIAQIKKGSPRAEGSELSLVQNDDLEEEIALESMATKAHTDNKQALYHLAMRLDTLVTDAHIDEDYCPVSPSCIAEVLMLASSGIELDVRCKIILYKHYDLCVMSSLKQVLEKSNRILVDAGILPDLRYKVAKKEENTSARAKELTEALVSNLNEISELNAPNTGIQFQSLQDLLKVSRSNRTASMTDARSAESSYGQGVGAPQLIQTSELLGMLDNVHWSIQKNLPDDGFTYAALKKGAVGIIQPSVVALSIRNALTQNGNKIIDKDNEDVIDLVEMLFEIILNDNQLPSPIQALLSRLQIPIIKVALKDRDFFNLPGHPARQLLNDLAKASIGWTPESEGKKDNLLERIYDIVEIICLAEKADTALFEELRQKFFRDSEKEQKRIQLAERRTKEYELGASKVRSAKNTVANTLYQLCQNRHIPNAIHQLLQDAWKKVLYTTYINEGHKSKKWEDQVCTAKALIMSVQPCEDSNTQARYAKQLPELLEKLHYALTEIAYDPFELNKLFGRLESAHIAAFRELNSTDSILNTDNEVDRATLNNESDSFMRSENIRAYVKQSNPMIKWAIAETNSDAVNTDQQTAQMLQALEGDLHGEDSSNIEDIVLDDITPLEDDSDRLSAKSKAGVGNKKSLTAIEIQQQEQKELNAELLQQVEDLPVSQWYIFDTLDGMAQRYKLLEKLADTQELVFVNRKGIKACIKSYQEMMEDLRIGTVQLVSNGSLTERAFGKLFQRLKGDASPS